LSAAEVTIRDAHAEDAEAEAEAVARRVARLNGSDADRVVVAESDGEVVGLASLHESLSVE
jgi:hypothetical protein